MKKRFNNSIYLEGILYDVKLTLRTVQDKEKETYGKEYYTGEIKIATNDAITNIVTVRFQYVGAEIKDKKNEGQMKPNPTFVELSKMCNGTYKNYLADGDAADKFKINSNLGLNEFYDKNDQLVSYKTNTGGFIHHIDRIETDNELSRATFDVDMYINNVTLKEADEDRGYPEKVIVKGAVFNYNGSQLFPLDLSVLDEGAKSYFLGLEATSKNPVFTNLRGQVISEECQKKIVEPNAWGTEEIRMVPSTHKDYVITWARKEPYDFGDESVLTSQDIADLNGKHELDLSNLKARHDQNITNNGAFTSTPVTPAIKVVENDNYKF